MPSAMVTFNGRITLPPDVRKQLGLRTGDKVEFVEIGKGRFAIAPGAGADPGSDDDSIEDPRGWIPKLDFSPTDEEPRFKELEESIQ
ncbi:MAG TPA: AbrB/MazE/SpoVT family DNA-binding domain-containing protein [Terracidiphilus sp.]|jgi:AbrB family looped-hinge helix DNA binding protein